MLRLVCLDCVGVNVGFCGFDWARCCVVFGLAFGFDVWYGTWCWDLISV